MDYVTQNTITIGKICEVLTLVKKNDPHLLNEDIKKINKLSLSSSFKASTLEALSGSSYFVGISMMLCIGVYAVENNLMNIGAIFASAMYIERVLGPTTVLTSIYFSSREAFYRRSRIQKHII
jgi:ABC-type bacteriocin/lantibiotic exporter with double-glycine peptidase domain